MAELNYPDAIDPLLVGTYPTLAKAGGGLVWDAVLEYRVWCSPHNGAPDMAEGSDYFHSFATFEDAARFASSCPGGDDPLALVLQEEYLDESEPGRYVHVRQQRVTEWPVEFLRRPRRTERTILDFLAPEAPTNRLAILRGEAT